MSAEPNKHPACVKKVKDNTNALRDELEKKVIADEKDSIDQKTSAKKDNVNQKVDDKVDTDSKVNADKNGIASINENVDDKENKASETECVQRNCANEVDSKYEDGLVRDLIADLSATKVALDHDQAIISSQSYICWKPFRRFCSTKHLNEKYYLIVYLTFYSF